MFKRTNHLITLLIFVGILSQTVQAQSVSVASATELRAAINSANGGEKIILAAADYGNFDFHDYSFSDFVTIQSESSTNRAKFGNIDISNSSYLRFESIDVKVNGREGVGIFNGSHHIEIIGLVIEGGNQFDRSDPVYTQVSTLYGLNANGGSNNLRFENNYISDVKSTAYLFSSVSDLIVIGNDCDWTASDCYKLAGVDKLVFENNFGARNIYGAPDAHIDFVQGQGSVSNSVFRGNVALSNSSNSAFQGLFFDDATFTNLTFENNIIATTSIRGISVSSPSEGTPSSGIIARNNTVIRVASTQKATLILIPSGSINEYNFVSNNVTKNEERFIGTNIIGQWDDANDIAHYDLYYTNADKGFGLTPEDLTPVNGSLTETTVGAFERIFELIQTGSPFSSGDQNRQMNTKSSTSVPPIIMMLLEDN